MKVYGLVIALCASVASAGVVITPITPQQVVPNAATDCFFGVSTPQGCGPLRPGSS